MPAPWPFRAPLAGKREQFDALAVLAKPADKATRTLAARLVLLLYQRPRKRLSVEARDRYVYKPKGSLTT